MVLTLGENPQLKAQFAYEAPVTSSVRVAGQLSAVKSAGQVPQQLHFSNPAAVRFNNPAADLCFRAMLAVRVVLVAMDEHNPR